MKLYMMRHGETSWNKIRRIQGQSDIDLNEAGREAARLTSKALKDSTQPIRVRSAGPGKRGRSYLQEEIFR